MSEFIYLFRIGAAEQREAMGTPEHAQQSMRVWRAWMGERELEAKGHLKNPGQPLEPEGKWSAAGRRRSPTVRTSKSRTWSRASSSSRRGIWRKRWSSKRLFDLADAEFMSRVSAVRRALYLLFNEGYHGASAESAVRVELCSEAIRLRDIPEASGIDDPDRAPPGIDKAALPEILEHDVHGLAGQADEVPEVGLVQAKWNQNALIV